MQQKYAYRLVMVGQDKRAKTYHDVTPEHSAEGWRLLRVFAPGAGGLRARPASCEVIPERPLHP